MSFKYPVVMPKMSMTMEAGELIGFHVKVGDMVKRGDVLFEVMTDKIDMEVEAPEDGVIESLLEKPGAKVEVGNPVLVMVTETEVMVFDFGSAEVQSETPPAATGLSPQQKKIDAPTSIQLTPVPAVLRSESVKAVPKARATAAKNGIDLRTVTPTGPEHTITMKDLLQVRPDPKFIKRKEANRALVARGIELSRGIAQTTFTREVIADFDQATLIASWASVLRGKSNLESNPYIGVALIVESRYGSALPVFRDPDLCHHDVLRTLVSTTIERAKHGKVPVAMLTGATTTVFDLSLFSMSTATPLLFPNQATSVTIGIDNERTKVVSLTIDLNTYDFYDGVALLDSLVAALAQSSN